MNASAISKALTLRDAMRAAAIAQVSPSSQAVLAILIAEAWPAPDRSLWRCRISQAQLAARLAATDRAVRNWLRELEAALLITTRPGRRRTVQSYIITPYAQVAARHTGTTVPLQSEPLFRPQRNQRSAGSQAEHSPDVPALTVTREPSPQPTAITTPP